MYRNTMVIKNMETTSFSVLSDKMLFPYFDEKDTEIVKMTNFELVKNMFINRGYGYKVVESSNINEFPTMIFTYFNGVYNTEIRFETHKTDNILLHDIYSSSINKREFQFFISFIDRPLSNTENDKNPVFMSQYKHVENIIDNLFYVN